MLVENIMLQSMCGCPVVNIIMIMKYHKMTHPVSNSFIHFKKVILCSMRSYCKTFSTAKINIKIILTPAPFDHLNNLKQAL